LHLNLTNLKDLEYICQLAADYFEPRYGMPKETEWLTRISRYRQLIQGEIDRHEAGGVYSDAEEARLLTELKMQVEVNKRLAHDLINCRLELENLKGARTSERGRI
jgi:hypothetical protein